MYLARMKEIMTTGHSEVIHTYELEKSPCHCYEVRLVLLPHTTRAHLSLDQDNRISLVQPATPFGNKMPVESELRHCRRRDGRVV